MQVVAVLRPNRTLKNQHLISPIFLATPNALVIANT
jgi:hypothetical protein